jgi:hypothetical protein
MIDLGGRSSVGVFSEELCIYICVCRGRGTRPT